MKKYIALLIGLLLIPSLVWGAGNIRKDWNARAQIMGSGNGYQTFGANIGANWTTLVDMNDTNGWEGTLVEIQAFDAGGAATATGVSIFFLGADGGDALGNGTGVSYFGIPDISFEIDTALAAVLASGTTKTVLVYDTPYFYIAINNTTAADTPSVRVYERKWRWYYE